MRVIAEPGRFYVDSAFTLACQVHSKREVRENGELISTMYYINEGAFASLAEVLYNKEMHPVTLKSAEENLFKSSIWGCTLTNYDLVTSFN